MVKNTPVVAVVINADLTNAGVHVGLAPFNNAAIPAMCGLDIEVPEIALKAGAG